ncbi:MAG: hypothetical protein KDJ14_11480 [Xanthomonadales bacterium]|nr:hypothetical protein [Xanthomonadales bacterium]
MKRLAVMVVLGFLSQVSWAQPIPISGVRIVGVVQQQPGSREFLLRVHNESCHSIRVPPDLPSFGALLELQRNGQNLELRIGFSPGGMILLCGTPADPWVYLFPLGELESGTFSLHLVGVDRSDSDLEYSLDQTVFTISQPPVPVPASGTWGMLSLSLLLGLAGAHRMRHFAFSSSGHPFAPVGRARHD